MSFFLVPNETVTSLLSGFRSDRGCLNNAQLSCSSSENLLRFASNFERVQHFKDFIVLLLQL